MIQAPLIERSYHFLCTSLSCEDVAHVKKYETKKNNKVTLTTLIGVNPAALINFVTKGIEPKFDEWFQSTLLLDDNESYSTMLGLDSGNQTTHFVVQADCYMHFYTSDEKQFIEIKSPIHSAMWYLDGNTYIYHFGKAADRFENPAANLYCYFDQITKECIRYQDSLSDKPGYDSFLFYNKEFYYNGVRFTDSEDEIDAIHRKRIIDRIAAVRKQLAVYRHTVLA